MGTDRAGGDSTPRAGEGGAYRKTPTQLATDPAFTATYASKFRINVNDYGAGSAKTAAVNTTAVQAALAAGVAAGVAQREVFFPDLTYNLNAGQIVVTSGGVTFSGNAARSGRANGNNASYDGGTTLVFHGNGAAIAIGTDNGHAWDAVDYDGPENTTFRDLRFRDAQDGTGATAMATVPGKNYVPGNKAIVDWRGGGIQGRNLRFDSFEYGFWGIQSDVNTWDNVMAYQCRYGMWLGPRSDQNAVRDLYCYACDYPLVIDGAQGTTLYTYVQVGAGPCELRNTYSRGTKVVKFISPWFEYSAGNDYGTASIDHFLTVGDSQTTSYVSDVHVTEPTLLMTASPSHVHYFAEVNNADVLYVEKPGGRDIRTFDNFIHIPATSTFSPRITLDLGPNYSTWNNPTFKNDGSGAPLMVRTPRSASAVPTAGFGYGMVGDVIYNSAPATGGPVGWVCVAAGAPGTWQEFGAVGNQVGGGSGGGAAFRVSAGAGSSRIMALSTNSSDRFQMRLSTTAESGSNAGSDFEISARSDTNTAVSTALTIKRSNGVVSAGAGFQHKTKAGTPTDADFATAPADGTVVVDTSTSKIWVRLGGTWKSTTLA